MVCSVPGCHPTGGLVKVVRFPTEDGLRQRWLQAVEAGTGTDLEQSPREGDLQLCSGHFQWSGVGDEREYREPTVFKGGNVASCRLCHQFLPISRMIPSVGGKFADMDLDTVVALVLRITLTSTDFLRMVCDECLVKVDLIRALQEQFALQQDYYGGFLNAVKPKLELEEIEWKQQELQMAVDDDGDGGDDDDDDDDDWKQESEEDGEEEEESEEESEESEQDPEMMVEVELKKRRSQRKSSVKRKKGEKKNVVQRKKGAPQLSTIATRTCNFCKNLFDSHSDLMVHLIEQHETSEGFTCDECDDGHKFPTIGQYNRHLGYHDASQRPNKCSYCPIRYRSEAALKRHENSKHDANHKIKATVARESQCDECGKIYSAQWKLNQHIRYNHRGGIPRSQCKICPKSFATALALRTHMVSSHTNQRPFQCEDCEEDVRFKTTVELRQHKVSVHEGKNPFRCGSCDISFLTKREYVNHRHNEHRNRRMYYTSCKLCPEIPQSTADLLQHIAACHPDVEYPRVQCPYCPQTFLTAAIMGQHKRLTHPEHLPLDCKVCGKKYSTPKALQEHMDVVHMGKPPTIKRKAKSEPQSWTCPTCGKQFSSKQNLQRHEKAVHLGERNFQCDLCPKAFSTAVVLQNHRRCVHTGEALHECPGCGQRFKENGTFYRHRAKCVPGASKRGAKS